MSRRLLPLLASTALFPVSALAQTVPATPAGGTVVAGQATIGSAEAGRLTITQTSAKAAINWESFSVGPGGKVEIAQPTAQSILLNRVTGAAPSTIAGNLTANGHVYLINPNGILITKTGTISAAGLVASTLDITPDALFAADRQIIAGAAGSSIVNDGQIRIAQGGYAALIGGTVRNTGLIAAPMGHVSLAAGATATIDFSGDGFLQVAVPDDGIETVGMLDHGMVAFRPGVAMAAARRVVNLSAANQAVSVTGSDGSVVLSGTVDVASASGLGGDVTVTGRDIALVDATIDASGALGGGRIRIGGDWQGQGDLPRADTLTVDAASTIRADAPQSGDGGSVVLWSDNVTDFRGTVSARSAAGIGGDAEISGKALLNYAGSADLRGLTFGTLLLDPYNITISSAANSNVFGFTPNGNNSVINATLLVNALATANVSISTGAAGSQAGTISLNTNISWQSSSTLTLTASDRISLSGDINAPNGGLALSAGTSIDPLNAINVNRFTLLAGFFSQSRPDGLPAFFARDFRVTGDLRRTSFIRNLGGDGNGDPFIIADIYGLQGLRELNPRVASNALLAQDLDASVTATWNGGQGFQPLGSNGTPWQWNLNGNGRRINNLTINRPTVDNQGLIGLLGTAGSVGRVILSNASIIGQDNVGALVGSGSGAISSSYVEDSSVRGRNQVGGVVGLLTSTGSLNLSFAFADVTGSTAVGGLIGYVNGGSVDQTWSSGAVRGTGNSTQIGGLVGRQTGGAITASYWDIETSGQISSFGGTGLTTAQARRQSSYVGFDFNTSWFQGDGTGDIINPTGLRPVPQTFGPPVFTSGAVLVTNLLQLQIAVRNLTNNIILFNDIDASASAGANPAGIWSSAGFFPLGNAANPFTGSIDGAGSVIRNLTINRPTSNDVGLVGVLSGTVRNVALVDSNITGQNSVGGLVGRALPSANITQSYSAAPITGVDGVGGLVGFNEGQIQNSYASGPVTGALAVGGLVGTNNGSISQAYATGRVTGLQSAGGLVGAINASSSVINGYWDIQTTGLSTSQGGGVGLTTADAQDLNRFRTIWAGFDFNSVWAAPNQVGQNNNSPSAFYPEIFSTSRIVAVNPSGTGFYGNAISPITAQYLGLQPSLRIRLVANGPLISLRSTDRIVSPGTFTAPVSVTSPVGSYAISGSGVQANDSRYRYVYLPSSYEVTPRPVTITADALSRIYGDANPALTYQVGGLGLVNGDTLGGMLATAATTTSNVGSYAITQGSLSASSNYALTYVGSQLSVTPRALTVVS
ncbi:MAG: filamentous hemagglutinin N-terminal domain-containing protein, partial [Sphingomonas sp.]|nr:filamentous hemagglutinin N-terminal domain-containing protein [Sphingomonas sp.]